MVVCKAVSINPPLSPRDTPGHAQSSAAERSPRGQQLGAQTLHQLPKAVGQLGVLSTPGGHKRTPQSTQVPMVFCNKRWLCLGPGSLPAQAELAFLSPHHSRASPGCCTWRGSTARQPPRHRDTPLHPPRVAPLTVGQLGSPGSGRALPLFPKTHISFFPPQLKAGVTASEWKGGRRGTMPAQQAGRGRPAV